MIHILAETRSQAESLALRMQLKATEWKHVANMQALRSMSLVTVFLWGTWNYREDAVEMLRYCREKKILLLTVDDMLSRWF